MPHTCVVSPVAETDSALSQNDRESMSRSRSSRRSTRRPVPFLVLDENRFAWTAVSESHPQEVRPDRRGGTVLVYGPSGCGKTHLSELLRHPQSGKTHDDVLNVPVIGASDFIELTHSEEPDDAVAPLIAGNVFVFEDVQLLVRHSVAQRRLAALLDEAARSGTTTVCTSLHSPGDLKGLQPKLANRLRSGVSVAMRLPGPASREKLLQHFCTHLQIALPMPVIRLFARELSVSPRELLGVLLRFDDQARQQQVFPDATYARRFLKHELQPRDLTVDDVAKAVARQFGVRLGEMRSAARDQSLTLPRQCAMYLARELIGERYTQIGASFGGRSHSTVLHACSRITKLLADDPGLRQQLRRVQQVLKVG